MYKARTSTEKNFLVESNIDGFTYSLDKDKSIGTTPVGYLVVALSSCAIMCVRGYFIKFHNRIQPKIDINTEFENMTFNIEILIDKEVNTKEKFEIIKYINDNCHVKEMLKPEIKINYVIN